MMETPPDNSDERQRLVSSGDYSRYGIANVPHYTTVTPLGKTRTFAGLYPREWAFLIVSTINILAAAGLTVARLVTVLEEDPSSPDFTFVILLLLNEGFCCIYVVHGLLRERKYELFAFIAAILVLLFYCILEYAFFNTSGRTTLKLVRLILICVLAPFNIYLAWSSAQSFGYLEFRIVGASELLQKLYRQTSIFSSLLKFDVQITASFVVLALKEGTTLNLVNKICLGIGLPFSLIWAILGWFAVRKEIRTLAVFVEIVGLCKPAYYLYSISDSYMQLVNIKVMLQNKTIVYSLLAFGAVGVLVWFIIAIELVIIYQNFGKGLRERAFEQLTKSRGILNRWRSDTSPDEVGTGTGA